MKTVCIVFHNPDKSNGAVRSLLDLIEQWHINGKFKIICILPRYGSAAEILQNLGITVRIYHYHGTRCDIRRRTLKIAVRNMMKRFRLLGEKALVRRAYKELAKEKINLVYSNTGSIYFGICLAKHLKVPHFWHIREMGKEDQDARLLLGEKHFSKMLNSSDRIITISKTVYDKYSNLVNEKTKVKMYYNDIAKRESAYYDRITEGQFNVGIVGSIIPGKGHEHLVRAISLAVKSGRDNVHLYVAGKCEGEYYSFIKNVVSKLEMEENIHFLGHVNDMESFRREMHVQVIASKCEAFGRITVEAMIGGLPVIGANTGCTEELIDHGKTGLVYQWGNKNDLFEKIIYAYENYGLMLSMAKNAEVFSKQFTEGRTAGEIEKEILEF